jgi:hypothetical protein
MNITKEQLNKYIAIQKKERGIQLTEKEAMDEALSLLLFVRAIYRLNPTLSKRSEEFVKKDTNKKVNY